LTSHLHSKLNRCTDSPRPPGVDPRPARSKHELSPLIMRRHNPSYEEGAETHSRSLSHGSSTMRGAPFTSSSLRDKGDAHSCAEFWARRSLDLTRPVPRNPAKVKHFAILENIHLDSSKKRRRATSHPPDGRAPPGGMATLLDKPRTPSDSSALDDLDRHRGTIGERKQIKRQRRTHLVTSMVRAMRRTTINISKTQELS
jgi:hypothetical protein